MARLPGLLPAGPIDLRRWRDEDAPALVAAVAASLEELRPWMPWAQDPPSLALQGDYIGRSAVAFDAGTEFGYGMFERSGEVVGGCGLHASQLPRSRLIGYWVRSDRHRRGHASRATLALTEATFRYLPEVDEIHVTMDEANIASAGVPPKVGFILAGSDYRARLVPGHTGRYLRWAMARADWNERLAESGTSK